MIQILEEPNLNLRHAMDIFKNDKFPFHISGIRL